MMLDGDIRIITQGMNLLLCRYDEIKKRLKNEII